MRILHSMDVRNQHTELIAAEPRHQSSTADRIHEAGCNLLKQQIANRVTERIVDRLESIQV